MTDKYDLKFDKLEALNDKDLNEFTRTIMDEIIEACKEEPTLCEPIMMTYINALCYLVDSQDKLDDIRHTYSEFLFQQKMIWMLTKNVPMPDC
jgi:hypothetical protein